MRQNSRVSSTACLLTILLRYPPSEEREPLLLINALITNPAPPLSPAPLSVFSLAFRALLRRAYLGNSSYSQQERLHCTCVSAVHAWYACLCTVTYRHANSLYLLPQFRDIYLQRLHLLWTLRQHLNCLQRKAFTINTNIPRQCVRVWGGSSASCTHPGRHRGRDLM